MGDRERRWGCDLKISRLGSPRGRWAVSAKNRDFEFRDQIQSAALTVINNIDEGFERRTEKDFEHFFDQAKGSSGEVRSMLYLAEDRHYAAPQLASDLRARYAMLTTSIGALASRLGNP